MRSLALITCIAFLGPGQQVTAIAVPSPTHNPGSCLPGHRVTLNREVKISNDRTTAITLGPLETSGKGVLERVVLAVSVSHTQPEHLALSLQYDADRDGTPDASSPVEFYLARRDPCAGRESWACPIELSGTYYFVDGGWKEAGEMASFDVFAGLRAGGEWYLSIVDDSRGCAGTVHEWSIWAASGSGESTASLRSISEGATVR